MKRVLKLIAIVTVTLFLAGCEKEDKHALKVGVTPWPGYEPLFLATHLGMYEEEIKFIRFSSPSLAYRAFKSGSIDVVALTSDEIIKSADYGSVPNIILVLDISNGADAIVAKPDIKTLADVKGKRVALESSTLAQHMLYSALEKVNLTAEDMHIVNIEISEQPRAYKENKADVFVTFEPSKSLLLKQGARKVFDSSMIPNQIMDVLAASAESTKNHPLQLKCIEKAWYKALDYIDKHPKEAYKIMGELEGLSAQEFENSLDGLKYGSRELNEKLLTNKEIVPVLSKLQTTMLKQGLLTNKIDLIKLIGK